MKHSNTKQQLLDQIAADMIKNNVCPDLAKTATHLVPGEGSPDAAVMFIGEAPGKNEDLTGRPFVGAAGKFLEILLAHVGLRREDVFITSIVKYRPPHNRDPLPAEKAASWPYLLRQIEVIDPRVIVTLGRHSMGHFLPGKTITSVHGQAMPAKVAGKKRSILPLFHPAAVLYNNSMKQTLMDDITNLKQLLSD